MRYFLRRIPQHNSASHTQRALLVFGAQGAPEHRHRPFGVVLPPPPFQHAHPIAEHDAVVTARTGCTCATHLELISKWFSAASSHKITCSARHDSARRLPPRDTHPRTRPSSSSSGRLPADEAGWPCVGRAFLDRDRDGVRVLRVGVILLGAACLFYFFAELVMTLFPVGLLASRPAVARLTTAALLG